jgi:hypothetical protein
VANYKEYRMMGLFQVSLSRHFHVISPIIVVSDYSICDISDAIIAIIYSSVFVHIPSFVGILICDNLITLIVILSLLCRKSKSTLKRNKLH